MYVRWLAAGGEAVKRGGRGEGSVEWAPPDVVLDQAAHLPDDYVPDAAAKLDVYRRLARAGRPCEIAALREGLRERFGPSPQPVQRLLLVAGLRALGAPAGLGAGLVKGERAPPTLPAGA